MIMRHRRLHFSGSTATLPPAILGSALEAWYDAAVIAGADASSVNTWQDSSGNSRTITYGATKPVYRTNQINGLPCVQFSGAISSPTISGSIFSGATAVSGFYVFRSASTGNGAVLATSSGGFGVHEPWDASTCYLGFGANFRVTLTPPASFTGTFRIGAIRAGTTWRCSYNGTERINSSYTFANPSSQAFNIGVASTGWVFDGMVAEVILCRTSLSDADAQKVEGYLAHKYGLQSDLPVGHPYKSSPP